MWLWRAVIFLAEHLCCLHCYLRKTLLRYSSYVIDLYISVISITVRSTWFAVNFASWILAGYFLHNQVKGLYVDYKYLASITAFKGHVECRGGTECENRSKLGVVGYFLERLTLGFQMEISTKLGKYQYLVFPSLTGVNEMHRCSQVLLLATSFCCANVNEWPIICPDVKHCCNVGRSVCHKASVGCNQLWKTTDSFYCSNFIMCEQLFETGQRVRK